MATTAGISTTFKVELLKGNMALGTSTATSRNPAKDVVYGALYLASANLSGATKASYGGTVGSVADTGEATGSGYTPGGVQVSTATEPSAFGTTAAWTPSASIAYGTVSLTAFDGVLLFNNSHTTKASIAMFSFGSQTVSAGTFTLTMPTNDGSTGLIRLA